MILQKKSTKSTTWRCNIRNRTHWCKATVLQKGEEFIRGVMTHEHAADPGITKKTKVKAKVKESKFNQHSIQDKQDYGRHM